MIKMQQLGKVLKIIGILLLIVALIITVYIIWDEHRATESADRILNDFKPTDPGELPDYSIEPNMEMPIITIDGHDYIGKLEIPVLELELPIMSEWSYPNLKISPCRYFGSAYSDDLVIAAHNYQTHFGRIKNLSVGDLVIITDCDGNIFTYKVGEIEILEKYDSNKMKESDWDLTLFTCTYGGASRVTVRCAKC